MANSPLTTHSPIKINLALHVGPVRADGYHPVDTLCVFMDGHDRLTFRPDATGRFTLEVTGPFADRLGPAGADNLVLRAARPFAARRPAGGTFDLFKAVPPASGLGGGTGNGAAALHLLNRAQDDPLPEAVLLDMARGLGADGAVCMAHWLHRDRVLRARGIGEHVTRGPRLGPAWLCVANPLVPVPTGAVFAAFDRSDAPGPLAIPARGPGEPLEMWLATTRNDLAPPARQLVRAIADLEHCMAGQPGCRLARMSGSGASVFGLFSSHRAAERAERRLRSRGNWAISGAVLRGAGRAGTRH
jgi:4-diphosphocytidyl-2-C-methyl-D-erythritol kinase